MNKLQSMMVEELQQLLNQIELLDSWQAAQFLGLKPATLRNPKNKYKKLSIKIGQYLYWRKQDIIEMMSPKTAIKILADGSEGSAYTVDIPKFSIPSTASGRREASSGTANMTEREIAIMVINRDTGADGDWIANGDFDGTETIESIRNEWEELQ